MYLLLKLNHNSTSTVAYFDLGIRIQLVGFPMHTLSTVIVFSIGFYLQVCILVGFWNSEDTIVTLLDPRRSCAHAFISKITPKEDCISFPIKTTKG